MYNEAISIMGDKTPRHKLDEIGQILKSDEYDSKTLSDCFSKLSLIVEIEPSLAEDVFSLFKIALESDINDGIFLDEAYRSLYEIARNQPVLSEGVFSLFKIALKSDKNDSFSLRNAYRVLGRAVLKQPKLAKDVLPLFNTALESDKNDSDSLQDASSELSVIVEQLPNNIFIKKQYMEKIKEKMESFEKTDLEEYSETKKTLSPQTLFNLRLQKDR